MGALVICGLQLAPANHAAALGPGVNPAWVALLGFLVFARRPSPRVIVGAALCAMGVLRARSGGALPSETPLCSLGDAMFLAASALGALYVLQLRSWGVGAIQGAAIVSLYSAIVVVPWYLWSAPAAVMARSRRSSCCGRSSGRACSSAASRSSRLNHAIAKLGAERSSALSRSGAGAERDSGARVPGRSAFAGRDRRHSSRFPPASRLARRAATPAVRQPPARR